MYSSVFAAKALIWSASAGLGLRHRGRDRVWRPAPCPWPRPDSPAYSVSPSSRTRLPVLDVLEQLGADVVDQRDARPRSGAAGPRLGYRPVMLAAALTTAATWLLDQRLGADPVEVGVVDDGDVAGAQPLGEVLGALVHPRRRSDAGQVPDLFRRILGSLRGSCLHRYSSLPDPVAAGRAGDPRSAMAGLSLRSLASATTRSAAAAASSSPACARPNSESSRPASIRDSSRPGPGHPGGSRRCG